MNAWVYKHGLDFELAASFIYRCLSELEMVLREKRHQVVTRSGSAFG